MNIDVIIPVYNGLPYVLRTLDSVLKQTLKPKQIIVVNDGSKDDTQSEIEKFIAAHPEHNFLLINKPNGGHSSATNVGIQHSKSEYIALVDADDLWLPTKLEKQAKVFKESNDPKLGIVYTNFGNVNKNDEDIDFPGFKMEADKKGNLFSLLLQRGNLIAGSNSAVLIKRECFNKGATFDEFLRCGEDWDMWINLARDYHFDNVPEVLVKIRRHDHNLSNIPMIHLKSNLYILQKWKNELNKLGGSALLIDHLVMTPPKHLFDLFFKEEHGDLRQWVADITKTSNPKLIVACAIAKKFAKKLLKILHIIN
jgi:glycosyltransferase involved in cell wall biosynthesis